MNWWPWKKAEVVPAPNRGEPTEIVEADVQHAYRVGLAQGEINGRLALARELEAAFGAEEVTAISQETATLVRHRQVH